MFEISATELMVIAVVAIVVIGPKDLPDMLRGLGRIVRKMRLMAGDFQRQMDQAGFEDVRKSIEEVRSLTSPSGALARSNTSALEEDDKKSVTTQKAIAPKDTEPVEGKVDGATSSPITGEAPSLPTLPADQDAEKVSTTVARVSVAHDDAPPTPAPGSEGTNGSVPLPTATTSPATHVETQPTSGEQAVAPARSGDV